MFEVWAAEAANAPEAGGGYWQLALILAAIGFLGLFARWRKARMPPLQTARELRARDTHADRYREAADKALVDLLETSRVLNAQVDTKIRVLNQLVKDAEERAAKLESLLSFARAAEENGGILPGSGLSGAPGSLRAGVSGGAPAAAFSSGPAASARASGESSRAFLTDMHERIHRLKTEGRDTAEIAKATNLSTTEVEFIVRTLN